MTEQTMTHSAMGFTSSENDLRLTDRAVAHIKRAMADNDAAIGFRVAIKKTGCSGWMYAVEFAEARHEDDVVITVDQALDVYVDAKSLQYLKGTEIDFIQDGLNRQLKFNNPNVTSQCGCGESFAVE